MRNLQVKKLTEGEVRARLTRYADTRDEKLRGEIVLQYGNLVESIGRRFLGAGEPIDDLVQEGYIGLITAVDHYDASKGVKFSTYATHFVIGQIKHYLRDKGKIIKEPAWLQELNQRMGKIIESLSHQLGRQPTEQEIGDVMDLTEDAVADLLTTREVFKVASLDGDRDDSSSFPVDADKIKSQKSVDLELPIEDKLVLKASLERLKSIEQTVINYFFYLDLNQTEIAKKLGISCNYVSHILRNSTKKLKKILMTEELKDAQIQLQQMNRRVRRTVATPPATVVDSVTGLYSRSYFVDRLDEEITRACRYKYPVGIVFVKFGLKSSAPSAACLRTENVLTRIAGVVRDTARKLDVVTRYDDDIFALILPHTGEQSGVVSERIAGQLRGLDAEFANSRPAFIVTVKVASAAYPDDAATARDLIHQVSTAIGIIKPDLQDLPKAA